MPRLPTAPRRTVSRWTIRIRRALSTWALQLSQPSLPPRRCSPRAGSMEFLATGAWTKRFHPGWAAHNGLIAAALARQGFSGPETIIEGTAGFVQAYSQAPRPERVTQGLGNTFEILATAVKPHACCRYMQAPIDAILALVTAHNIAADEVAQVTLAILETAFPIICEPA